MQHDLIEEIGLLLIALLCHEIGHALMAQRLGLRVKEIVITPLGGMASIEGLSARPIDEAKVAAAGPAVNLLIAAICLFFDSPTATLILWINLGLGIGNLLPIFPLDGGRILRGLFSAATTPVDAIYAVGKISKYLCIVLILLGFQYKLVWFALALGVYSVFSYKKELMMQILGTGINPSRSLSETVKQTYHYLRNGSTTVSSSPKQPGNHDDSLEEFGGSLEEYFENKK